MLILIVAIVEVVSRIWWSQVESCAFENSDVYENIPPSMKKQMCVESYQISFSPNHIEPNQNLKTININSYGFRGKEVSLIKPENTYRIFNIGGSTMLGTGSTSDVTTVSGFLQSKYDESGLDRYVEVINAGVSGAWSQTETNYIKTKLLDFDPDLFIVYDGWNDSVESLKFDDISSSQIIEAWKNRWEEICLLGKERNFDTIIIIQPMVTTGHKPLTESEYAYSLDPELKKIVGRLALYAESLKDLDGTCTATADLRNAFDGIDTPIFWDYGHVGNAGNEIIAQKMLEISMPFVIKNNSTLSKENNSILNKHQDSPKVQENNEESSLYLKDEIIQIKRQILTNYKTPLMLRYFLFNNDDNVITHMTKPKELRSVNLAGRSNLQNYDLSMTYLPKSDFSGKDLRGANLFGAYLRKSQFQESNLQFVNMTGANLSETDLRESDLSNADLRHTDFSGAILKNSNLENAKVEGAIFTNANLRGVNLVSVDLRLVNLLAADLQEANLQHADLSGHDLRRVFLMNSDLSFANMQGTYIDPLSITGTNLFMSNFTGATIQNENFSTMNVSYVDFSNAYLKGSNFSNSNLTGINFSGAQLDLVDFKNSNLEDSIGGPFFGCINHPLCIKK